MKRRSGFRDSRAGAKHRMPSHAVKIFSELKMKGDNLKQREIVLQIISLFKRGLNSRQIAKVTNLDRTSVTGRLTVLKEKDMVQWFLSECPFTGREVEFYVPVPDNCN